MFSTTTSLSKLFPAYEEIADFMPRMDVLSCSSVKGGFPPYNIINADNETTIEVALAGFNKNDVRVEQNDRVLTVSYAKKEETKESDTNYAYKGISSRSFTRTFTLAPDSEISSVKMVDGLLTITVVSTTKERKPKTFEIE